MQRRLPTKYAIDEDRDHLEDFHEVLERYEEFDEDGALSGNDTYRKKRFRSLPNLLQAISCKIRSVAELPSDSR